MKDFNNENQNKLDQDSQSQESQNSLNQNDANLSEEKNKENSSEIKQEENLAQNESKQAESEKKSESEEISEPEETSESEEEEEKKIKVIDKIKASFTSRKFRGGAYATVVSAIVIALVLLVNFFVTQLDWQIDISKEGMYTLTDETKDFVKGIKDKITIYYIVESGKEDDTFTKIVEKYPEISDKIKVVYKDPVLYPNFASKYTDEEVSSNSIIVVNESNDRAKYIDNSDMYQTEFNYNTYQSTVTAIDVEGQVTSALEYVTTEDLPVMYTVTGHGETEIGNTLSTSLKKANVTIKSLETLKEESIPDDCSVLFINGPQKDYTEDEVAMIKDYLANGGNAIILVDYNAENLENFNSLMNYYGISFVDGVVVETQQGYYMGKYVNNLMPNIKSHDITSSLMSKNTAVIMPSAIGIRTLDSKRSTTEIDPLFTTSDSAFSKVDVSNSTIEKQSEDIDGPFDLGVAITEKYNDIESKIIVLGSTLMIDEQMLSYNTIGNLDLMVNSVNYVTNKESSLSIRTRSVTQQYLTLNAAQVNFWAILVVVVIPVFVLAFGGFICVRRRKK
ncbi:MAG: ABC-transp-aux domain-containing protein [Lachnoclostridium sp.]|jgi:ABC-2 type transport system permease protein